MEITELKKLCDIYKKSNNRDDYKVDNSDRFELACLLWKLSNNHFDITSFSDKLFKSSLVSFEPKAISMIKYVSESRSIWKIKDMLIN